MTGTNVITERVRIILDDVAKLIWTDDDVLIRYLNDGTRLVTNLKPESLLTAPYTRGTLTEISALANTLSISDRYREAMVDYVVARALAQEAQDERDLSRANSHMQQFIVKAGLPIAKVPAISSATKGRRP